MQPPEGPPVWTALILPPSGAPPPMFSTIWRSGVPMGTSIRPVLVILPASANTLVPLLFSVPIDANQSAPLRMIAGHVGKRLDVVDQRRAAPQPAFGRERRARTRRAAFAFDGGHQGRFLAANERAGADAQVDVKIERRFENAAAQQAALLGLFDRGLQPADRQRIFGADINESLGRADGVGGDGHAFEDAVRVAFQNATVHERAGVAFVGVANDVFVRCWPSWPPCAHFRPVGKPAPPRPRRPLLMMSRPLPWASSRAELRAGPCNRRPRYRTRSVRDPRRRCWRARWRTGR